MPFFVTHELAHTLLHNADIMCPLRVPYVFPMCSLLLSLTNSHTLYYTTQMFKVVIAMAVGRGEDADVRVLRLLVSRCTHTHTHTHTHRERERERERERA